MEKILSHALALSFFKGYLSKDPELQYFESGKCCVSFSLPLKKSKDDEAVWLNCKAWGEMAETISDTFTKGDGIMVGGTLQETEYKGKTYITLNVVNYWRV